MADGSCAKSSIDKGVWFLVAFAIPCCTLHLEHKASSHSEHHSTASSFICWKAQISQNLSFVSISASKKKY
jgi:hypothetical protein